MKAITHGIYWVCWRDFRNKDRHSPIVTQVVRPERL